jgi:hypothetical protein
MLINLVNKNIIFKCWLNRLNKNIINRIIDSSRIKIEIIRMWFRKFEDKKYSI